MRIILAALFLVSCASRGPHLSGKYKRSDWKHWTDQDRDCQDTRSEILASRSLIPVRYNKKGCKVVSGKWDDYYFPEVHLIAKKVDIDHLVPLKNAFQNGGNSWTQQMRERFANDPENLVVTNLSYNRQKGAKGIDFWLPIHLSYACRYMNDWMKIKKKYNLNVTQNEKRALDQKDCATVLAR